MKEFDPDLLQPFLPLFCEECDLPKVIDRQEGMLDLVGIDLEGSGDSFPDIPFSDSYPQILKHDSGEVSPFEGTRIAEQLPYHFEFLFLRPVPASGSDGSKFPVYIKKREFLGEE